MKARALIGGASFGAETVKAMGEAFDEAWARMAPTFGNVWRATIRMRLRIASSRFVPEHQRTHLLSRQGDAAGGALLFFPARQRLMAARTDAVKVGRWGKLPPPPMSTGHTLRAASTTPCSVPAGWGTFAARQSAQTDRLDLTQPRR